MAAYDIGKRIRGVRESRNLKQEELAQGICSVGTLSKIENGIQIPKRKIFMALMQRLGEPEYLYSIYLSQEEMQEMELCKQMRQSIWKKEFEKAKELLEQYKFFLNENNILEMQSYHMMSAFRHAKQKKNPYQVMLEFEKALRVTRKEYPNGPPDKGEWLTFEEISILNSIAVQYYKIGESSKSFSYLKWLKEYLEQMHTSQEMVAKAYPFILCNYAGMLCLKEKYEEAQLMALCGIRMCREYAQFAALPYLLVAMARSLTLKGMAKEAEACLEQAESLFCIMDCCGVLERLREHNRESFTLLMYM